MSKNAQQARELADEDDLNDIGNAERFANGYFGTLAFVPEAGTWRRWNRTRWTDSNDEAMRSALVIARSWFDDLARESGLHRQRRLLQHAQRSCGVNSLRAMIDIAKTLGLTVPQREWDADPMLLGVENGVVDLRSGSQALANPQQRISKAVAAPLATGAQAPESCSFLDRIFAGDATTIEYIQRAVGYCLESFGKRPLTRRLAQALVSGGPTPCGSAVASSCFVGRASIGESMRREP